MKELPMKLTTLITVARKEYLKSAGALLALFLGILSLANCGDGSNGGDNAPAQPSATDSFTRMFPDLPSFAPANNEMRMQLKALGQSGGVLDAQDQLVDPLQSILNPAVHSPNNHDNPNMTAGATFLGQFLDHDITLDLRSPLAGTANPGATKNSRTPAFDLDSVYGGGPDQSPELYDLSSGDIKMRVEAIPGSEAVSRNGVVRFDLPRDTDNKAIISDARNDEHLILSQFHLAMLRFHNAVVDHLRADASHASDSAAEIFSQAQRLVRWHYQWIIVHEFLPLTIGQELATDILVNGQNFYKPVGRPKLPVEFTVAAYRFGHSQVRPSYRANFGPNAGPQLFLFVFDDSQDPTIADPNDLRGAKRAPRRFIDWQTFFNFQDGTVRPSKIIDAKLSTILFALPGAKAPAPGLPSDGVQSLASRNLMRHLTFGLPSGQAVAQAMGVPVLTPEQLSDLVPYGLETSTPLWFYVLKEAEIEQSGRRLGSVGGRIVGEVFVGLLKNDPSSYLAAQPNWTPALPAAAPSDFRVTDLLRFAGVVVDAP